MDKKDNKGTEKNRFPDILNKVIKLAMILMLLVSGGYLLAGQLVLPNDRGVSSADATSLDLTFDLVNENGELENISLPITYDRHEEDELTLRTVIPSELTGEWLMIWNMGHVIDVYVDDEIRMRVDTQGRRLFKGDVPYQYDFMRLYEGDGGRELTIRFPRFASENHQLGSIYMGDKASLLLVAIKPYQFSLFLALAVFALGLITIVKARFFARRKERAYELFYVSLGVTVASAWFLFNSPAAQFLFPNIETAKDCAFFFASMIPLPFLLYISSLFKGRYAPVFTALKIASILSFFILTVGFLLIGGSINTCFIPTELTAMASLGISFTLITADFQNRKVKEYFIAAIGLVGFILFALLYVILFAFYPYRGDSGTLLMVGIICLYSSALISYRRR